MSEHGLVGRIVGVTRGASRIMLLTDPASRTPVLIDRTNGRAILTGDGGPNPRLEFLRGVNPVRAGDPILTSGDGGVFPRGLPVGVAVRGLDGVWRARLYSDRAPIDYVRILHFEDFGQLTNPQALTVTTVPPVILPPAASGAPGGVPPGTQSPAAAAPGPAAPGAAPAPGASVVPRPTASPPAPAVRPTPRPAAATPRPATSRPAAATSRPAPPQPAPVQTPAPAPAVATPPPAATP
jgi:rod shape-determining protein MreC